MISSMIAASLPTLLVAAAGFVPAILLIALAVADALTVQQLRYASRHLATPPTTTRPLGHVERAVRRATANPVSGRGFVVG